MKNVIYDADMGGDDLWAIAVLSGLIKHGKVNLLGMTTCFGNTTVSQATQNALDMMSYINLRDIPVFEGGDKPLSGLSPLLDGAYGSNGLSNASLPKSNQKVENDTAEKWLSDTLTNSDSPIIIVCTGPLTNIAKAFQNNPDLDNKGLEIIWLGGALNPSGGGHVLAQMPNGEYRQGNITQYAEFNAINDPIAAQIIANLEKTKVTIIPLDCTHHMGVNFQMATQFLRLMKGKEVEATNMLSMLDHAAALNQMKMNAAGAHIHDAQVMVFLDDQSLFLDMIPVKDIKFVNDENALNKFDATKNNKIDFSLLAHHGQMTAVQTDASNINIVPGLYSFTDAPTDIDQNIESTNLRSQKLWETLINLTKDGFN